MGVAEEGPRGCCCQASGGVPGDAYFGAQGLGQDRLCKASRLNKLTVLQGRGLPACPWGGGGGAGGGRDDGLWGQAGCPREATEAHGGSAAHLSQGLQLRLRRPVIVRAPMREVPLAFPVLRRPPPGPGS